MSQSESSRKHYEKNKEQRIFDNKERKRRNTLWYKEYKSSQVCKYCGENHPACIDFHHTDASQKEINPSQMITQGWSIARMQRELAKCEPVCRNCHARIHWGDGL